MAAGAGIAREPDVEAVEAMFFGRFDARGTMLRGISRFPRASTATVGPDGRVAFQRYWDPEPPWRRRASPSEAQEHLATLLDRAVARSLTGEDDLPERWRHRLAHDRRVRRPHTVELTGEPLLAVSSVYPEDSASTSRAGSSSWPSGSASALHAHTPTSRPLDDAEHWVDVLDGRWTRCRSRSWPRTTRSRAGSARGASSPARWRRSSRSGSTSSATSSSTAGCAPRGPGCATSGPAASPGRGSRGAPALLLSPRLALGYRRLRDGRISASLELGRPEVAGSPGPRPDLARPARRRWLEHQLDPLVGVGAYSFDADALAPRSAACMSAGRSWTSTCGSSSLRFQRREVPDAVPKSLLRESVRGRLPDELLDRADKTFFNDFALRTADYEGIRRLALTSELRIEGVDYGSSPSAWSARDLDVVELLWAYDLARVRCPGAGREPAGRLLRLRVRSSSSSPTCARAAIRSRWPRPTSMVPRPATAPARMEGDPGASPTPSSTRTGRASACGSPTPAVLGRAGAGRVEVPADGGLRTEERLWGIPALFCFRARGDLPLHAAAVETEGGAVPVAAPRTYGKTTMAAAFHRAGAGSWPRTPRASGWDGAAAIVPGPAMLRVRLDVAERLDLPRARLLGEDAERAHYALDAPGDCEPVPLRASSSSTSPRRQRRSSRSSSPRRSETSGRSASACRPRRTWACPLPA